MSTAIITPPQDRSLKSIISSETMQKQFAMALPKHLSPERFARIAITALIRTPKLQECTQESVMKCLLDLSAMGIEPDGRRAYLIPYGKEATLIVSYMGLVELVRRSGDVTSIRAEIVCEKDAFSWNNGEIRHEVNWRDDRGKMQAAYAVATLASGETQSVVMRLAEIEGIRKRSKSSGNGPWVTDFNEMAKKTCVRRLVKMLPISSEIMESIEKGDEPLPSIRDITPARTEPINPFAPLPEPTPAPAPEPANDKAALLEYIDGCETVDDLNRAVAKVKAAGGNPGARAALADKAGWLNAHMDNDGLYKEIEQ